MRLIILAGPPSPSYEGLLSTGVWCGKEENQLIYLPSILFRKKITTGLSVEKYIDIIIEEMILTKHEILLMGIPRGSKQLAIFLNKMRNIGITIDSVVVVDVRHNYFDEWKDKMSLEYDYCNYKDLDSLQIALYG